MKILVVVDSINVEDSSGSKVNVALIKNLAACKFDVCVLHYTRKEIKIDGVKTISIPEKKWNLFYLLSRTERVIARNSKINLNPYLEGWFGFSFTYFNDANSIAAAIKKQSNFNADLVLTLSKAASFRPHFALLKFPELHKKWMAYVHDPFPFHFYPRPYNYIQPGYAQKETFFREVSEKAKYSAFPSQLLMEWMGSYFPKFLETGLVIPHQLDTDVIMAFNFPAYFDETKFSLLHAGSLMAQRNPSSLIKAYQKLLSKYSEAKENTQLLLFGPADSFNNELIKFQNETPSLFVENRNVPFNEILAIQTKVSVNIILESKSEISPFLPGKFPHCIEANKPILLLSPHYSETKRLMGEDYKYWSEVDDEDKIFNHIEELYFTWKNKELKNLDRDDLKFYLSTAYLKQKLTFK